MLKESYETILELKVNEKGIYTIEDKIFISLMKEKGLSKSELVTTTNTAYPAIRNTIIKMEDKGYVVARNVENYNQMYFLTQAGVYEAQDRLNTNVFHFYHKILTDMSYPYEIVSKFLRNVFYKYYISGTFNPHNLDTDYIKWCETNGIKVEKTNTKKLKLNK